MEICLVPDWIYVKVKPALTGTNPDPRKDETPKPPVVHCPFAKNQSTDGV